MYGYYNDGQWVDTSVPGTGGEGVLRMPDGFVPTSREDWGAQAEKSAKLIGTPEYNNMVLSTDPQWAGFQNQLKEYDNRNVSAGGFGTMFKDWLAGGGGFALAGLGGVAGLAGGLGGAGDLAGMNLTGVEGAVGGLEGAGAGGFGGLDYWGDAGAGLGGDLGGVGGSGLTEAEMNTLIQQAQQEIANGSVGSTGAAGMGQASYLNQLQSLLNGGGTGNGSVLSKIATPNPASGLQKLLGALSGSGSGTGSGGGLDLLKVIPGLLGALGANSQGNAQSALAQKYLDMGAPYRNNLLASMQPGFDPTTIPGYSGALDTASKSLLAKLSAVGGNPYGNPSGLIEANKAIVSGTALPAIQQYQNTNAAAGGLANFNAAAPGLQQQALASNSNIWNSLGAAAGDVLQPKTDLASLLQLIGGGSNLNLSNTLA